MKGSAWLDSMVCVKVTKDESGKEARATGPDPV